MTPPALRLELSDRRRFLSNWASLVGSGGAAGLLGLLTTVRLARTLLPEGYGIFTLVQTLAVAGAVVAGLGLRNAIIRQVARTPGSGRATLLGSLRLLVPSGIVAALGAAWYLSKQSGYSVESIGGWAAFLVLSVTLWEPLEAIAFGRERMTVTSAWNTIASAIWCAAVWLLPADRLTLPVAVGGTALVQALKLAGLGFSMRREGAFRGSDQAPSLLAEGLPFYWIALLTMAATQLPVMALLAGSGAAETGLLGAGMKMALPAGMLVGSALSAAYPGLSRAALTDLDRFKSTLSSLFASVAGIGSAAAAAGTIFRIELTDLLFGPEYGGAANLMAALLWWSVLSGVFSTIGVALAALDRQRLLAGLSTAFALVTGAAILLTMHRGGEAMAFALMLSSAVNLPYHWFFMQRVLPIPLGRRIGGGLGGVLLLTALLSWLVLEDARFWIKLVSALALLPLPVIAARQVRRRAAEEEDRG